MFCTDVDLAMGLGHALLPACRLGRRIIGSKRPIGSSHITGKRLRFGGPDQQYISSPPSTIFSTISLFPWAIFRCVSVLKICGEKNTAYVNFIEHLTTTLPSS